MLAVKNWWTEFFLKWSYSFLPKMFDLTISMLSIFSKLNLIYLVLSPLVLSNFFGISPCWNRFFVFCQIQVILQEWYHPTLFRGQLFARKRRWRKFNNVLGTRLDTNNNFQISLIYSLWRHLLKGNKRVFRSHVIL